MRRLAAVLLLSALAACASAASDPPVPTDGVRGVVLAGPQCAVVVQGSPCPDRPWRGTVRVSTTDGVAVDEVETGTDGSFEVPLEAGSYLVVPVLEPGVPGGAATQTITVADGWVEVTLLVDSGIR